MLEVGDTFSLAGAVGPPLDARVRYTVTRPNGTEITHGGRANRIGYYYRPEDDFVVNQAGVYRVDVDVEFGGQAGDRTSAGQVDARVRGDVLGTTRGTFRVFVVPRRSKPLDVDLPAHGYLPPPAGFTAQATAPTGITLQKAYSTTVMPGFVLQDTTGAVTGHSFGYVYDPIALSADFPNLDAAVFGQAADLVSVTLFASGVDRAGRPRHAARIVVLHGNEMFNATPP